MKTLLEQVDQLDELIRQLRKSESMMQSGKFFDAHRIIGRLIAWSESSKREILSARDTERLALELNKVKS